MLHVSSGRRRVKTSNVTNKKRRHSSQTRRRGRGRCAANCSSSASPRKSQRANAGREHGKRGG